MLKAYIWLLVEVSGVIHVVDSSCLANQSFFRQKLVPIRVVVSVELANGKGRQHTTKLVV